MDEPLNSLSLARSLSLSVSIFLLLALSLSLSLFSLASMRARALVPRVISLSLSLSLSIFLSLARLLSPLRVKSPFPTGGARRHRRLKPKTLIPQIQNPRALNPNPPNGRWRSPAPARPASPPANLRVPAALQASVLYLKPETISTPTVPSPKPGKIPQPITGAASEPTGQPPCPGCAAGLGTHHHSTILPIPNPKPPSISAPKT